MKSFDKIITGVSLLTTIIFFCGSVILFNRGVENNQGSSTLIKSEVSKKGNIIDNKNNKTINMAVLGLDEEEVRADVILLFNFNPTQSKLNILSISRDTKIKIKGRDEKINALFGLGGEDLMIKKLEDITSLDINYYLTMNLKGFRMIIDTLGGVQMDVPWNMNYDDPIQNLHIHIKKGPQILDGNKAEQIVRYRKGNRYGEGYVDGDIGRIKMQQALVENLIKQKINIKYMSKVDDMFHILKRYVKTNVEIGDLNEQFTNITKIKPEDIKSYTVPGESVLINGVWYIVMDEEAKDRLIKNGIFK